MIQSLILQFVACITPVTMNPTQCMDIANQIVEEYDRNPLQYTIGIEGFPYDSDANRVANYWYDNTSGDLDMIGTFMAEAMFNKDAVGKAGEKGICQLQQNRTNNVWIKDDRRNDIMYQAEVCMDKYKAVPVKSKIRSGWYGKEKQKQKIYFF